ncbi:hypothetical protein LXA43DRAFT_1097036 [Ganoderma leucocontextum]|nr:hypothetical protein LXA43DRAFT_1097036 [Ganoderma leucocontextum]
MVAPTSRRIVAPPSRQRRPAVHSLLRLPRSSSRLKALLVAPQSASRRASKRFSSRRKALLVAPPGLLVALLGFLSRYWGFPSRCWVSCQGYRGFTTLVPPAALTELSSVPDTIMRPCLSTGQYKMFAILFRIGRRARAPIRWSAFEQGMRALDFEIINQKGTMRRFVAPDLLGRGMLCLHKVRRLLYSLSSSVLRLRIKPNDGIIDTSSQPYIASELENRCGITAGYIEGKA